MTTLAPTGFVGAVTTTRRAKPNPYEHPELFNTYRLAGNKSPGVVTFNGHDSKTGWDVKKGAGQDHGSMSRKGEEPLTFTASHYLVNDYTAGDMQIDAWDDFAKVIESSASGPNPKALEIEHPDLARNGIRSVVKESIGGFKHDGKGGVTVVVTYRKYEVAKSKPVKGPVGGSKPSTKNDPFSQALQTITDIINGAKKPQSQTLIKNP